MLRNYVYIDKSRLDMFIEQIVPSQPKEKKKKKSFGLSLTGPKIEISEETVERPLKSHEKIELLISHLEEYDLLEPVINFGTNIER